jgi:hypothetical protein
MTRARMVLAVALLLALPVCARAGSEGAGTTAANFLTTGAGGAALGMGGATLALGNDLAAVYWNPAALSLIGATQMSFSHAELPDASRQEWASLGGTIQGRSWHWALGGTFVNQGTFEGRDAFNQPTGSFNASSAAIAGSFARSFGAYGGVGVTTRWVTDKLGDATGSGFGFDAGLLLRRGIFGFGAGAQNLGGQMKYGSASYPMPSSWGTGISIQHPMGLSLAVDWNFPREYYNDLRGGVEYRWHDAVALRAGYRRELASDPKTEPMTGPSFGLGAGSRGLWFDYAYMPSNLGTTEHRIAVTFTPSRAGLGADPFSDRVQDPDMQRLVGPPAPADEKKSSKKKKSQ